MQLKSSAVDPVEVCVFKQLDRLCLEDKPWDRDPAALIPNHADELMLPDLKHNQNLDGERL